MLWFLLELYLADSSSEDPNCIDLTETDDEEEQTYRPSRPPSTYSLSSDSTVATDYPPTLNPAAFSNQTAPPTASTSATYMTQHISYPSLWVVKYILLRLRYFSGFSRILRTFRYFVISIDSCKSCSIIYVHLLGTPLVHYFPCWMQSTINAA